LENHMEERNEPEVEVNRDLEEYSPSSKYQKPRRSFLLNKWVLVLIFLIGGIGVGLGLWMLFQSGVFPGKKQSEFPEFSALRAEVQKMKSEIEPLKNEIQSLKVELKALQDRINVFQGQSASLKDQVTILAKKRDHQGDKKPAPKMIIYKIKKGDTVASIAKKFRVGPDDLRRWNNLPVKGNLNSGQVITIYFPTP
jgi:LysM repeat protein